MYLWLRLKEGKLVICELTLLNGKKAPDHAWKHTCGKPDDKMRSHANPTSKAMAYILHGMYSIRETELQRMLGWTQNPQQTKQD